MIKKENETRKKYENDDDKSHEHKSFQILVCMGIGNWEHRTNDFAIS